MSQASVVPLEFNLACDTCKSNNTAVHFDSVTESVVFECKNCGHQEEIIGDE
jgi:predicted RNA-binding Zn-ribbon protein involved in translation (DUF1610 family)